MGFPIYLTAGFQLRYKDRGYHGLEEVTRWHRRRIDTSMVTRWLQECKEQHGNECNKIIANRALPRGFRVIDTTEWRVVNVANLYQLDRYMALSYVWAFF